jgi:hypothetical protein
MLQSPLTPADVARLPQGTPTIIIPFRDNAAQDRANHLKTFVTFMKRWHSNWNILIIEQSDDDRKFNRGALLNIGARLAAKEGIEYVIFHDVDIIPYAPQVPYYTAFPTKPIHVANGITSKYAGNQMFGGIVSMSIKDIKSINGFPNNFWGWGGEDDSMRNRLKVKKIEVYKPTLLTGFKELPHIDTRTNKDWKNMRKWEDIKEDNGSSGYKNVHWKVLSTEELAPNAKKVTVEIIS